MTVTAVLTNAETHKLYSSGRSIVFPKDTIGDWDFMFARVKALAAKVNIQQLATPHWKISLSAIWIKYQCLDRVNLSRPQRTKLDSLGFRWQRGRGTHEIKFDFMLAKLKAYVHNYKKFLAEEGPGFIWKRDPALAKWALRQRGIFQQLSKSRRHALNVAMDNFLGDPWITWCQKLTTFRMKHGHCRVDPASDARLTRWMAHQQDLFQRGELNARRTQYLQMIGFLDPKPPAVLAGGKRPFVEPRDDGRNIANAEGPPPTKLQKIYPTVVDLTEDLSKEDACHTHTNVPLPATTRAVQAAQNGHVALDAAVANGGTSTMDERALSQTIQRIQQENHVLHQKLGRRTAMIHFLEKSCRLKDEEMERLGGNGAALVTFRRLSSTNIS